MRILAGTSFSQIARFGGLRTRGKQQSDQGVPPGIRRFLARMDELSQSSRRLTRETLGRFDYGDRSYFLPRYVFRGTGSGALRLGLFGLVHGDEPEGGLALSRLIETLCANPQLARAYELSIYPLCNPTGYEDGTRTARTGLDLNREFWIDSPAPEVRLLERELLTRRFDGLVALHTDDTADGTYGFVRGRVLSAALLEPALRAGEKHLPRSSSAVIDGFAAERGIIHEGYGGILGGAEGLQAPPFEIVFETPGKADPSRQIAAAEAAILAIMERFREFIAFADGI